MERTASAEPGRRGPGLRSLSTRLIVAIGGAGALILSAVLYKDASDTREILEREAHEHTRTAAHGIVSGLRAVVRTVESGARMLGAAVAAADLDRAALHDLIKRYVHDNPALYGSTVAFVPGDGVHPRSPYYHRSGSGLEYVDLADPAYDYTTKAWYLDAARSAQPTWSEPYFDTGGGEVDMVTFSLPVTSAGTAGGPVVAVVTADVSLDWLRDAYLAPQLERLGDGAEVVVLSPSGRFVSRRDREHVLDDAVEALAGASAQVQAIAARMLRGEEGSADLADPVLGARHWIHFAPLQETAWSVGVLFLESRVLSLARSKHDEDRLLAVAGVLVLVVVVVVLARRITRPLRSLAAQAAEMGTGRLDVEIPGSGSGDEVDALAGALRTMQRDLAEHVERLATETEARTRMETELRAARDIQLAMLPAAPVAGAGPAPCDIAATLVSAREVGGDLYDFFTLADGRLAFAVGDVSGKGVPAALFMARTLTLFKLAVREEASPGSVLERLNRELERENDACMFVTMLCGIFDPASGVLRAASAGHNPPLIAGPEGARYLDVAGGTVLGVMPDVTYPESELTLGPGEVLVVYTDGVTEATDTDDAFYGEERLLEVATLAPRSGRALLDAILADVDAFATGAPQADDITVLALRVAEPSGVWELLPGEVLELPSTIEAIGQAREWMGTLCRAAALPSGMIEDIHLVCEEVLANIVHHAHADDGSRPMVVRARATPAGVSVAFRDSGPAYNPLDAPEPALDIAPDERPIGGLGVHLLRRIASRIDHSREDGHNVLVVRFGPPGRAGEA